MPLGAPSHVVPKSGCRFRSPHDAIKVNERGSTDAALMSAFHGLSAGKGRRPSSEAPPFVSGGVCDDDDEDGSPAELHPSTQARIGAAKNVIRIVAFRWTFW